METLFITGGTGYIGSEVVETALEQGYHVQVLTRSSTKAKLLEEKGVEAIVGDLITDDHWQDTASKADYMIHVAAPPTWGKRVSKKVALAFQHGLYEMTERLLQCALENRQLKKLVYVAGTSYFGDTGSSTYASENFKPIPKGWGPYLAPAVDALEKYTSKGVPIVTAFPGGVYGPDSWCVQLFLKPLFEGKKITGLKGYKPYFSPIHLKDCARALVFLLQHGQASERYFLVDDQPMTFGDEFLQLIEKEMKVTAKTQYVPRWLCTIILGPVLTEYSTAHNHFSNRKLRDLGFDYLYPNASEGLPVVVESWLKQECANIH
ncbi:NAD-dependent epimerase/dehydratase family protein [Aquibacillus albus]|uniref:Nucleoside-diphosphate-sugar epimerase n=1 Tax=Aquibacillus albus TaxID=1168171 RepID=A0ABS2N5Q1_9BACI|nr:NAD(P)-dependent oxidoreductase [Aquibacillus albus]MBM7573438.1 nucleoside-diphosphate-sugar epimerase [Aquibacillus albus]